MDFVPSTFFIQLISFLILFALLSKFAFKPLFGIMEKRRQHVLEQITTAEQNRSEATQFIAEQKAALEQARKEAQDIIEQAKLTSSRQAEEISKQARAEADRVKEEALKEIESEKNKAVAALQSQVSAMAVMIASKIIEKQVDEKSQQELIDQYLKQAGGH